jgi:hypothetical protein
MSTTNVNNVLPTSGTVVNVNGVATKDVVNGPFVLYGGTAYQVNTTTGAGSTIVGFRAMANSTGINNTAVGLVALQANTTGGNNTVVGSEAFKSNTTGGENTAIGKSAMATAVASQCVAIGVSVLNETTGNENVGVGNGAGSVITSGSSNTLLGNAAGFNITTGSNNTCIGDEAAPATATTSNSITLGNSNIAVLRCNVTSITSLSDARDKKEITELSAGLDFVKKLKPVEFVWNERNTASGKRDIKDFGFIAQDLKKSQEDAKLAETLKLVYEENPEKLEASYGKLIPILVKAIQDLSAKVEALEAKKK